MPQYGSKRFIKKPEVNLKRCNDCKSCARLCPVGAIDMRTLEVDNDTCIRCMSCVKNCLVEAREIEYKKSLIIKGFFNLNKADYRQEPRFYF